MRMLHMIDIVYVSPSYHGGEPGAQANMATTLMVPLSRLQLINLLFTFTLCTSTADIFFVRRDNAWLCIDLRELSLKAM